jgi:hypothetical protein
MKVVLARVIGRIEEQGALPCGLRGHLGSAWPGHPSGMMAEV